MNNSCYVNRYTLRDIFRITTPLMFSALATTLMIFIDRFILGLFSVNAMVAVGLVGNYVSVIVFFFIAITSIATIFVGQYNGEYKFDKLPIPVWQMIYLCLALIPIFLMASIYTDKIVILPDLYLSDGIPYQKIMMAFGWVPPMYAALSAFFIGRGKTMLVTSVAILSNIINFALDFALIFGIDGIIDGMGTEGAAIATVVSEIVGLVILFIVFLNKRNRTKFNTLQLKFDKEIFWSCLKIGTPLAIERALNLLAWFLIYLTVGYVSNDLATLESITVNFYLILCCYTEGLNKGIAAIAANLLGENRKEEIKRVLKTFLNINVCFSLVLAIPLVFYQDIVFAILGKMNGDISHLHDEIVFILYVLFIIILADGVMWILAGLLSSGGDTMYPMIVNTALLYVVVVIPTAIMYYTETLNSMKEVNSFSAICSILTAVVLYKRYKNGRWIRKIV